MSENIISAFIGASTSLLIIIIDKIVTHFINKNKIQSNTIEKRIDILSNISAQLIRIMSEVDVYNFNEYPSLKKEYLNGGYLIVSRDKYIDLMVNCVKNRNSISFYDRIDEFFYYLLAHQIAQEIEFSHLTIYKDGNEIFDTFNNLIVSELNKLCKQL